jgi:ketosteroid isomerase-like protein
MNHRIQIAIVIVGVLLAWSCSPGGESATTSKATIQPADFTNDKATIIALEKKWAEAIVSRDMATLNEVIADDFVGTSWAGTTYSKSKAIDDLEFRVYVAESLELEGINVNVFGDTAVVTLTQIEKSKYNQQDCSGRYGYADVWIKRDGRWQAVSSYGRLESVE